jgi:hypothetical protein
MSRIFHCHKNLTASWEGPLVGKQPLHLRQGMLDWACGSHAAMMALTLLGALNRDDIDDIDGFSAPRNPALTKLWKRSTDLYFTGSTSKQLQSLFIPYNATIKSRLLRNEGRNGRAIECLKQGGLCILGFHNQDFSHWTLVIGISTHGKSATPEKFLLLDSDAPTLPLTPWNATLTVTPNRRGLYCYETTDVCEKVIIDSALALTPVSST